MDRLGSFLQRQTQATNPNNPTLPATITASRAYNHIHHRHKLPIHSPVIVDTLLHPDYSGLANIQQHIQNFRGDLFSSRHTEQTLITSLCASPQYFEVLHKTSQNTSRGGVFLYFDSLWVAHLGDTRYILHILTLSLHISSLHNIVMLRVYHHFPQIFSYSKGPLNFSSLSFLIPFSYSFPFFFPLSSSCLILLS